MALETKFWLKMQELPQMIETNSPSSFPWWSPSEYDGGQSDPDFLGLAMKDLALELKGVTEYLSSELKP